MNIKETKKRGKLRRFGAFVLAFSMIFGPSTPAIAVAAPTPTAVEERVEKPAATPAKTPKEAPAKTEGTPAQPEETAPVEKQQAPAKTEEKPAVETQAAPAKAQKNAPAEDGLEISPESTPERVGAGTDLSGVKKPTVNTISVGTDTVSGKIAMGSGQRGAKHLDFTIKVTVNRKAGETEEKTFTILQNNKKQDWSVTFSKSLEVGDQVVVAQLVKGKDDVEGTQVPAEAITITVQETIANQYKDKLIMPSVTIHPEDPFIPSDEYRLMLIHAIKELNKKQFPDIVDQLPIKKGKIKGSNEDVITTLTCTSPGGWIQLTFSDGSQGSFEAKGLHISAAQERTPQPKVEKLYFTDNAIKGQLAAGTVVEKMFTDEAIENAWTYPLKTKIEYRLQLNYPEKAFCLDNNCKNDKNDEEKSDGVELQDDGSFSIPITSSSNQDGIQWNKKAGIKITEPGKKPTCTQVDTHVVVPAVTPVRDPRKLTDTEKATIDQAIRDANTRDGVSKLPDMFQGNPHPAFIDFDKDGNARIIDPNDVEVDWDSNSNPIFQKNDDGTYKLQAGKESQVITIPAKDLVKNLPPEPPMIAVDTDTGKVTVTPPAYKAAGDDTDLASYTLTYKDKSGAEQTVTATRDLTKTENPWSGTGVDPATGVITLDVNVLEVGGTLKAVAKDKGGIAEGDTDPKTTETTHELPKATLTFAKGDVNATGAMDAQEVNQGGEFTLPENGFERPQYKKFKEWSVNGTPKQPRDKIDHVESDTTITAVWEPIMVKVKYDAGKGGTGSMDALQNNAETVEAGTYYKFKQNTFKAPAHKEFDTWSIAGARVTADGVQLEEADITVTALWKYKDVKVTYKPGDGSGPDKDDTAKESQDYTVKENSFTAPENKEFHHWLANVWQETNTEDLKKNPNDVFKIYKPTEFTAQWKFIQVDIVYQAGNHGTGDDVTKQADKNQDFKIHDVKFEPDTNYKFIGWRQTNPQTQDQTLYQLDDKVNAGTGKIFQAQWELMERTITVDPGRGTGTPYDKTMIVGQEFELPQPSPLFQAPENEEFSHWKVGNDPTEYKVGDKFEVKDNVTVEAQWKPIVWELTVDPGTEGAGQKTTDKIEQGTKYQVPQPNTVQAKEPEKYEFSHWTVNGEKKDPGTEIVIKGKTEVVAHWKIQKKTVTYENGGGDGNMDPVTRDYGTRFTLPQPTAFTAPANKEFSHWEITGDSEPRQPGYAFDLTKNITVKAVWKDSAFTVTYEPGLVGSGTKDPVTVLKKAPTHELAAANTFRPYDGFEFAGWEIDGKSYEPGHQYTVTKNTTVTAKWRPKTIKLTFVSGEGSDDANIEKRTTQGGRYYLPSSEFKAKEGYQFRGWEINGVEKKIGDSVNTDKDVTITALWDKLVKVHYDANGGDWSGLRRKTESVPENKPFQLSYAPKQDGYVFDGWQAQGERKMYARATHPGTATEMTFVAQWRERGTSGGSGTPGVPPVIPGTEPGTPPVTPGTEPSTPPVTPGTEPGTPSMPSDGGIPDRDALLRRLKSLWNSSEMRRLLEQGAKKGQNGSAIPRAGVGTAERTASTVLFPVDLLPAKKREDD